MRDSRTALPEEIDLASTLIARPALTRKLSAALDRGALFLIAPAGSGKTVALEAVLLGYPGAIARVRCTSSDAEAGRLLDHLVDALCEAAPGSADALRETLATAVGPVSAAETSDELIAELERLVIDPLVVVFDDAEHVADDPAAAAIVGELVASESRSLRVALASRRPLPLRLAKLSATGALTVFGAGDLAFTADECEAVLRLAGQRDPTEAEVSEAMEVTEGWPLGLALRVGGRRLVAVPSDDEPLAAFLAEEVLEDLEPGMRRQLVSSGLPAELTSEMCGALGLDSGFLDAVLERNLFLRPVDRRDGEERRYAYHPLFREFLLERLEEELDDADLRELHAALADAISEDRPLDAVEHWLTAGREQEAIRLAGRHSQPLVRSAPNVVRRWIERLSPAGRSEPVIQLLEGQIAMGDGRPEDAVELLAGAAAEWERRGRKTAWVARFSVALTNIVLGQFDEVPPLAEGFDDDENATVIAAPMVGLMAGLSLGGSGESQEGAALIDRALAHPLGHVLAPYGELFTAYFVERPAGRMQAALARAEDATARLEELDPMRWMPYTLVYLASVHESLGDEDSAIAALERSREFTNRYGLGAYPAAIASAIKAGLDARAGRAADAGMEIARADVLGSHWHAHETELARAELARREGNPRAALAAAERAHTLAASGFLLERLRAAALLAPLLVDLDALGRAREVIDEALAACPPETDASRLLALRAWLRDLSGEAGGERDLVDAWRRAGDGGRQMIRAEWPRIERLAWRAAASGALSPEEIVEAVGAAFPEGEAALGLLDHEDPRVRRAAAAGLGTSGHPDAPVRLARLAEDPDPAVADAADEAGERLRADPPALTFTLFGGFSLRRGGRTVADEEWKRRVATRVVRFLLVNRDSRVPEDLLFDAFWPGRSVDAARRSLQVAVSTARTVLEPPGADRSVIDAHERSYRLELRPGDAIDTELYADAARAALADEGPGRVAALRAAAGLWTGAPLPEDRYEGWSALWRERLVGLHIELLSTLGEACLTAGDPFGATAAARQQVELDPLSESAHRSLIVAFSRSGRRGHALRQFLECRRRLVGELGIEPTEEMVELHRAVLAGEVV